MNISTSYSAVSSAGLRELRGGVAALAHLGDLQLEAAGGRVSGALAVPVASVQSLGVVLVVAGAVEVIPWVPFSGSFRFA